MPPNSSTAEKTIQKLYSTSHDDVDQRLRKAELLLRVSREMAAMDGLQEMLEKLVSIAAKEIGCERGTLFLNDPEAGELYSYIAQGKLKRRIRLLNTKGIAGHVFTHDEGLIVDDPYNDERFDSTIDDKTGYKTRNILCAPIRTLRGQMIGVIQTLNKVDDKFTESDLELLCAMASQAASALQNSQMTEQMVKSRKQETEFLDLVTDVTSEIDLAVLLKRVMTECTRMLNADRSTLFLNDAKTGELWSEVGEGLKSVQIRFPNHMGIAGAVYTSEKSVNIPHAYADLRFNPAFDKKTGYFTRSILCVPVVNKNGKTIGVTQVLNKKGGAFNSGDESRLRAFTSQVSIALENAKLFSDVQNMKNYNESMLESMSNGVITMDEDGKIVTCNAASNRIFKRRSGDLIGQSIDVFFTGYNSWLVDKLKKVEEKQTSDVVVDAEIEVKDKKISANISFLPLTGSQKEKLGTMLMIEDISNEKRMKSTMARYMDPSISEQLLSGGQDLLGGKSVEATVLFTDIRSFSTISEKLGAQGTVKLLNEYFTIMVDCLQNEGGMLDKFIGDAIMATFGLPLPKGDEEDRALRTAIAMLTNLEKWNEGRRASGQDPVNMGVGINTDLVVTGNIGSPKRMDYTSIGDGVNVAARLESACKQYFAKILISEYTHKKLKGTYRIRDIDRAVVKGKSEPVGIFEVLDYHTEESFPNLMDVLKYFGYGMEKYRDQKWDMAIEAFKEALALNPRDKLSQLYIDRSIQLKETPPGPKWDGVWILQSK